jgi:hypothetical protein
MLKKNKNKQKKSADTRPCAQCGQLEATSRCTQCQQVCYCDRDCQRAHWPQHRVQCNQARKLNAASAQKRQQDAAKASAAGSKAVKGADGEECAMCLDVLSSGECVQLPCGHVYHQSCVKGLRKYGVNDLCPVCQCKVVRKSTVFMRKSRQS